MRAQIFCINKQALLKLLTILLVILLLQKISAYELIKINEQDFVKLISEDAFLEDNFSCNITVGIPDTGIVNHPYFSEVNAKITYGKDWVDEDSLPIDEIDTFDYGHGTHIAGILAGLCPNSNLLISRVFGEDRDGDGYSDFLYSKPDDGLQLWLNLIDPDSDGNFYEPNSAKVISNSWIDKDEYGKYNSMAQIVDKIVYGMFTLRPVVIFPTGNLGYYHMVSPPGTAKNAITVGAVYTADEINPMRISQRGTLDGRVKPDVLAPGDEILSTVPFDRNPNGYEEWSGTSMAVPIVSALAAKILTLYPDATPELVKALIIGSSYGGGTTDNPSIDYGWGRISSYTTIFKLEDELVDGFDYGYMGNKNTPYPYEVNYKVNVSENVDFLVVTMVYSDEPGSADGKTLLNDLDLIIINPDGSALLPNGHNTEFDDDTNNVEKYIIKDPKPGVWTFRVTAVKLNDLNGKTTKYVPYAISVRAIKWDPEIQLLKLNKDSYGLIVRNATIYNSYIELPNSKKIIIGDIPAGVMKIFKLDYNLDNLILKYYDILGNLYTKKLTKCHNSSIIFNSKRQQLDRLNGDKIQSSVFRELPVRPKIGEEVTVYLWIDGVYFGGIKEKIPEGFKVTDFVANNESEVVFKLSERTLQIALDETFCSIGETSFDTSNLAPGSYRLYIRDTQGTIKEISEEELANEHYDLDPINTFSRYFWAEDDVMVVLTIEIVEMTEKEQLKQQILQLIVQYLFNPSENLKQQILELLIQYIVS